MIAQRLGLDWGDPGAVFAAAKVESAASFDIVGKMKGQVRNMELQGAGKQVPGPSLPLSSNLYLINRMKGALQQEADYANDFLKWRDTPEGQSARTPNLFRGQWYRDHPYQKYIDPSLAQFRPMAPVSFQMVCPKSSKYSPSRNQYRGPDGTIYNADGSKAQ